MKNALEINIGGIKCDNPNCDFVDMSVKIEDYDKWLNKPCPKCGENLLTNDDYRNIQFLLGMEELANKIYPKIEDNESIVKATINMNGTGDMNVAIDDNKKNNWYENKQRAKYGKCNGYYKWEYTKCVLAKSKTEDKFIVLPKDNKFISMLYTEQELKQLIKDNAIIL